MRAIVGWCGIEGHFVDPPKLFSPEEMSGGVWAALTCEGEFSCTALLGRPFLALKDDDLTRLHDLSIGQGCGDVG